MSTDNKAFANTMASCGYTVLLLAKNDADRVEMVLRNFQGWAPVVILDGGSTDNTFEIAQKYGAKFIVRPEFDYGYVARPYAEWALSQAPTEYVFVCYCSLFVPRELLEVFRKVSTDKSYLAVRHGYYSITYGKYVDRSFEFRESKVSHFFSKSVLNFERSRIHDEWPVDAPHERILSLKPTPHQSVHVFRDYDASWTEVKHNIYGDVEALERYRRGERTSLIFMLSRSVREFVEGYVFRKGFLAGIPGFLYHMWRAQMVFNVQARIWEYQENMTKEKVRTIQNRNRNDMLDKL